MVALIVLLILFLTYLFCLKGRNNAEKMKRFKEYRYAHRGLHDIEKPENSMAAFKAALQSGFGIEFDVHLLKDGGLAVIHDSDLLRVTGKNGIVENLTIPELPDYTLKNTTETIPEFKDVLSLYHGTAPLIIELKTFNDNYVELCEAVCNVLENYNGLYCLESFDPRVVIWLKKNRPYLIRGQLSENYIISKAEYPFFLKFVMTFYLANFIGKPDFIAYNYHHRKTLSNYLCMKLWKLTGVSWTIRSEDELQKAEKEGWIPIFENFSP